jgi:AcrR family transcriptional regulator
MSYRNFLIKAGTSSHLQNKVDSLLSERLLSPMPAIRLTSEARREAILASAKTCFARNGFAKTTTKSVASAAGISEGLLFKHFPTKSALYTAILNEACEADPNFQKLQAMEPSTATLVFLVSEMVGHFLRAIEDQDADDFQRMKLLISSHLEDGEFARLLYQKIGDIVGPIFKASLDRAIQSGDASPITGAPMNLFWFAHHAVHLMALSAIPAVPTLSYGKTDVLKRQICEFILRGVGLTDRALATHFDPVSSHGTTAQLVSESA